MKLVGSAAPDAARDSEPDAAPPVPTSDDRREPVVSISSLVKTFDRGRITALAGVTFSVPAAQSLAIIGSSGAGKSTLLRHLTGLVRPTSGVARVLGVDVASADGPELRRLRRQVGFIFQSFNVVGRVTCIENVMTGALGRLRGPRLGPSMYPRAVRREAIEELDRVGLADRAWQRTDTLSGGQQQRVAIARALFQRPRVMLADEPVASLDPETSRQVMDLLLRCCVEDDIAVICSLHDVDLALGWADRLIGLRCGTVVMDTPVDAGVLKASVMDVYGPEG